MYDPTSIIWRCTVQKKDGSFCDQRSLKDAPFPICGHHAAKIVDHMVGETRFVVESRDDIPTPEYLALTKNRVREHESFNLRRNRRMQAQTQVYYVRIGDHVKIGYSINMRQRLGSLRVDDDALLATEPGGRDLEHLRHEQFAAERVGRRENFNPSRRLLAHIEAIKAEHGPPKITTWQSGAA